MAFREFPRPPIKKVTDTEWLVEKNYKEGMNVDARIYATKGLIDNMDNAVFDQLTNVATLPVILNYALCMPDGHSGYGFPIGGVAAFDAETGVISPGGIGFDIGCGMRLMTTNLTIKDVKPKIKELIGNLFDNVPAGVGRGGFVKINGSDFKQAIEQGAKWCVENGYGWKKDLERIEDNGCMSGADSAKVSDRAIKRGINQIGTLGSGNHYLEIQHVKEENILDKDAAKKIGIFPDQIVVMFHCGSRGFGHQVATDYLQTFLSVMESKYKIKILDKELACAPFSSSEGQDYFKAMQCGVNMSYVNRQTILHRVREVFSKVFNSDAEKLGLNLIYDCAHNTAKLEKYKVDGTLKDVLVHRKGATRAFGPGNKEVPKDFSELGQPIIIGGSMETGSYLLLGTKDAEEKTFGSTAHGSGRAMSRTKARKLWTGEQLQKDMEDKGILVKAVSYRGLAEEAGGAYKNIDEVIQATALSGISKPVTKLVPIGNIKG